MPKQLRLLVIIILLTDCFISEAQIVKSSSHDEVAATKKRPLSTSTSSGGGAGGGTECWVWIHTSQLNLLDETTAILCLNGSITLSANAYGGNGYVEWYYNDLNHPIDSYYDDDLGSENIVVKKPGVYYAKSDEDCVAGILVTSTLPVNIPGSTVFCPGGSATLTAPAGKFSSYQWYNHSTLLDGKKQSKLTVTAPGNYSVKVTDNNNCVLNSDKVSIGVIDPPAKITVTGDSCVKATLSLDAYRGQLCPQSISWYKDNKRVKAFNNKGIVVAGGNGAGSGLTQLDQPYGVFLDSAKNVYVADHNNERIVKWAPGAAMGEVIWERLGSQFDGFPTDVLLDNEFLYVSTTKGVIRFDPLDINLFGYGDAWGLGIDSDRSIYFSQGGSNPEDAPYGASGGLFKTDISGNTSWVAGWDRSPEEDLISINSPNGIYVDASKNVYVADNLTDPLNNFYGRIVKWAPGATTGELVMGSPVGVAGTIINGPNHICFAAGITFDKKGNMYVSDAINNRVQLWKPGAQRGITIISGFRPWGIKVDDDMNVYVADQTNNRVLKFPSLLYNEFTPATPGSFKAVINYAGGCAVTSDSVNVKKCSALNNVSDISKSNLQWGCTINPNPVQNILRVQLTNVHDNTTVFVMDVAGRKLFTQHISAPGNNELNFNTGTLRAGSYFVQVISNNQSRYLKFIKQ